MLYTPKRKKMLDDLFGSWASPRSSVLYHVFDDVERIPDVALLESGSGNTRGSRGGLWVGRRLAGPSCERVNYQRCWVLGANHGNLIPRPPYCRARYWTLERHAY
jgi:hypothetical protein